MKFIDWATTLSQKKTKQVDSNQLVTLPFLFQFICIGVAFLSLTSTLLFFYLKYSSSATISIGILLISILSYTIYKRNNKTAIIHIFALLLIIWLNLLVVYTPLSSVIYFYTPLPIMLVLLFKIKGGTFYSVLAILSIIVLSNNYIQISNTELLMFTLSYFLLYGVALAYEYINFITSTHNHISHTRLATHSKIQLIKKAKLDSFSYNLRTPLTSILGLIELYKTDNNKSVISNIEKETHEIIKALNIKINTPKSVDNVSNKIFIDSIIHELITENAQRLSIKKYSSTFTFANKDELEIPEEQKDFITIINEIYSCILINKKGFVDIETEISPLFESPTTGTYLFKINISGLQKLAYTAPYEIDILANTYTNANMSVYKTDNKAYSNIDLPKTIQILNNSNAKIGITQTLEGVTTITFTFTFWKKEIQVKSIIEKENSEIFDIAQSTILIVEDNIMNQQMVAMILKKRAKHVLVASNGKEAIKHFSSSKIDVILMDIQMPILDGYKATKKIREMELGMGKHTPIIALTANAMNNEKDECFNVGMDGYLSKPFGVQDLISTIKQTAENVKNSI